MGLTKIEKETIITYNEEEKDAVVFTYSQKLKNKLQSILGSGNQDIKLVRTDNYDGVESVEYTVPKKWVKVSKPRKVSDENRKKHSEIMRKYQEERKTRSKIKTSL